MERSVSFDPRCTINGPLRSKARSFLGNDTLAFIEQSLFTSKEREKKTCRNTAIICTIGPASHHTQTLERLIAAGMNIARLNMAHSTHEQLVTLIKNIRAATQGYTLRTGSNVSVAIAMETQGSQKRTGKLENSMDEVALKKGATVTLTTNPKYKDKCNADIIYINGKKSVLEKSEIILDDQIHLIVESINNEDMKCTVVNSGHLGSWKKVCFPGELEDDNSSSVEIEEKKNLEFAVEQDIDIIILSHVMNAGNIFEARKCIEETGKQISLVAKLRTMSAMRNMKEIMQEVDGIMVAREELGIIFKVEKVFVALKNIITYCVRIGKPVICASVMLRSMVRCPRASQAESSDIANVVLDGVDCVVLSGETAIGNYPLESLRTMVKICNEAEDLVKNRLLPMDPVLSILDPMNTLALTAIDTALKCSAAAIMVITLSGRTAHMIARYRPDCLLIMVTRQVSTANQSHLYRRIHPILCDIQSQEDVRKDIDAQVQFGILQSKKKRLLDPGNQIVIIIGRQMDKSLMHTVRIEDVV
ncbi:pyruvate kinase-like [Nilaparvata lugens]|uniref:pyruvate kinase-like n=1 Tax=Nilaparvata lugens TaxID=108931 RepID=UPI00193EAB5F|nr:pyruvate kinase-like [Nilaparvata lugens]